MHNQHTADGTSVNRDALFSKPVANASYIPPEDDSVEDDDTYRMVSSPGVQLYYPLNAARISSDTKAAEFELLVLEVLVCVLKSRDTVFVVFD